MLQPRSVARTRMLLVGIEREFGPSPNDRRHRFTFATTPGGVFGSGGPRAFQLGLRFQF